MQLHMNPEHDHAAPQPADSKHSAGNNVRQAPEFQLTSDPASPQLDFNSPDFVQQLVDLADYRFLTNRKHHLGWHHTLAQKAPKAKDDKKVEPEDHAAPAPMSPEIIAQFCGEVDTRLSTVTFPTKSGTEFNEHNKGHRYMARSHDSNDQAAAHTEYNKTADLSLVGIDKPTATQQKVWEHFKIILGEEGDTSALNTWDAQIVTIGGGFGAKFDQAGEVLARLPQAYLDKLYEVGVYIGGDGSVKYLDTKTQKVYADRDAWKQIKKNHNLLGHITNLAQSEEDIATDANPDEKISMRDAMLTAQFEQFSSNTAPLFRSKFNSGPYNTRQMAIKMHHWLPGIFNWKTIRTMPTDFDAAYKWGRELLKSSGMSGQIGQYNRMDRFKKVTSSAEAKKYADKQFGR